MTLAALASLVIAAPASARPRACGNYGWIEALGHVGWTSGPIDGAGIFNVTARGARCPVARRVVFGANRNASPHGRWTFKSWQCRNLRTGYEYAKVRCTSHGRAVQWETGA